MDTKPKPTQVCYRSGGRITLSRCPVLHCRTVEVSPCTSIITPLFLPTLGLQISIALISGCRSCLGEFSPPPPSPQDLVTKSLAFKWPDVLTYFESRDTPDSYQYWLLIFLAPTRPWDLKVCQFKLNQIKNHA